MTKAILFISRIKRIFGQQILTRSFMSVIETRCRDPPRSNQFSAIHKKLIGVKIMTTYLAWKDPSCNGVNPQWEILSRKDFKRLVNTKSFNNRHFIRMQGSDTNDWIVIEATESQYKDWLVEKRHSQYLRDGNPGYEVDSYHGLEADGEYLNGEELLPDTEHLVEDDVFRALELEALKSALNQLNARERHLITYLYLFEERGTIRGYSSLTGIPIMTVHDRKKRVLKKLRKNI
jgi:hypothetical protein